MLLSFDLGTGGAKICIFTDEGELESKVFMPYETTYPSDRFHVQNPRDWWSAIVEGTRLLLGKHPGYAKRIKAIALSGQSLAVIPLDRDGNILFDDIPIWSDTRPIEQTERFFNEIDVEKWYIETGNGFAPECYSLFKLMWYKDNYPERFATISHVLGSKDYINYLLTGVYATDYSYASGLGAYSLEKRTYIDTYLDVAGVSKSLLPEPIPSTQKVGNLSSEAAAILGLSKSVEVYCGGVDNSCMALGSRNLGEGRQYLSLGSSAWIAVSSHKPLIDSRIKPFVFDHVVPDSYTSATSIFSAGNSLRWFRDTMAGGLVVEAQRRNLDPYTLIDEAAKASPIGSNGVMFNPTLAGAPASSDYPNIKGAFLNITLGTTFNDLARSVLEGVAFELCDVYRKLLELTSLNGNLVIVGGGSRSPLWLRMFSDILGVNVSRLNTEQDAAALGAAATAAVGSGLWDGFDYIDTIVKEIEIVTPDQSKHEKYQAFFESYRESRKSLSHI
ncbi:xylulokinase [Pleomorphochaeta sp. DL1XJH-081]|jgi:xylulokinase|uniref:xylulokinase n=1 Tax=Pleomorphochaeta sp. DL1XJH-081 TaxID=3409690 RepID=UPI003BB7703F